MVRASSARSHLQWLATQGVGSRTVAQRTGLARTTIQAIASGRTRRVMSSTADRIMSVHRMSGTDPGCLIDSTATLALLADLSAAGVKRADVARAIGRKTRQLRIPPRITKRTADRIKTAHNAMRPGVAAQ